MGIPIVVLVETKLDVRNGERGTWVHPRVALNLAQWCSPAFAVKVTEWLYDWMMGNTKMVPVQNQFQIPQTLGEALILAGNLAQAEEKAVRAKIAAEGHAKMMQQLAADAMGEMQVARQETRVVDEKLQVYPQSPTIKIIKGAAPTPSDSNQGQP